MKNIQKILLTLLLAVGFTALESVTKRSKPVATKPAAMKPHESKEKYLARCEARWECREQCCNDFRQCLHEKMQGKKGKHAIGPAMKSCRTQRQACNRCKKACMKKWAQSHKKGNAATTAEETTPAPSGTAKPAKRGFLAKLMHPTA